MLLLVAQVDEELAAASAAKDKLQAELDAIKISQQTVQQQATETEQQHKAKVSELQAELETTRKEAADRTAEAAKAQEVAREELRKQMAAESQAALAAALEAHEKERAQLQMQVRRCWCSCDDVWFECMMFVQQAVCAHVSAHKMLQLHVCSHTSWHKNAPDMHSPACHAAGQGHADCPGVSQGLPHQGG
jgi:hypothetical protein